MTEQTKHVSAQGTPPAETPAIPNDMETLKLLVQLMLAERQEVIEEKNERKRREKVRDEQRKVNAEYVLKEKNRVQEICTHKKGGKGLKSPHTDYAVYLHTFVDASSYIKCQICAMKWRKTDTKEYLVRRGVKIPNHTGLSWADAMEMFANSTNRASSSEVQVSTVPITSDVGLLE